ncbi:MAG: glycerol-3-phosphate dehydrogenase/oxidase [Desulfocucumaceae bacterium]
MESRGETIARLNSPWDVIVVGGGITGAGILREAAARGLRCILLEQRDFGWGTSSRSGKLVHGGLRYLRQGQFKTTWHSVREREKLLRECKGLVNPLGFLMPFYSEDRIGPFLMRAGLSIYDLLALRKSRRKYGPEGTAALAPLLKSQSLTGGVWFLDAQTDDARLVLRVIGEGVRLGGAALNYARVEELCRGRDGRVCGVAVRDEVGGQTYEVQGQVVISATGVWADGLRYGLGKKPRLRRLRGSHLVIPRRRFPLSLAVGFPHPEDGRPVYIFPWEGATLLGTTDIDHDQPLGEEPKISLQEGKYLLEGARKFFPSLDLSAGDVISTFSGVRPVVNTCKKDPSRESREHVVWDDNGLVTVTGGKLTTFRLLAGEALARAKKYIVAPAAPASGSYTPHAAGSLPVNEEIGEEQRLRLAGRYGGDAPALLEEAGLSGLKEVPGTQTVWAELRWAACHEAVVHLEDLLLRRVRLGILLPEGGAGILEQLRPVVQPHLGWDDTRWQNEVARYLSLWSDAYSPGLIT